MTNAQHDILLGWLKTIQLQLTNDLSQCQHLTYTRMLQRGVDLIEEVIEHCTLDSQKGGG